MNTITNPIIQNQAISNLGSSLDATGVHSVILTPINGTIQFRATINPAQVSAFQSLLETSGLITFPEGKNATDIASFSISVLGASAGIIQVGIK